MRAALIAVSMMLAQPGLAQDGAQLLRVSAEEWQRRYDEVSVRLGVTRRHYSAEHLVVFEDADNFTTHAFTQPGHAAHPAWISREVLDEAGAVKVRQSGFYAGSEPAFARLMGAFGALGDPRQEKK